MTEQNEEQEQEKETKVSNNFMDFSMPSISIDDIFDRSLLPF